MNNLLEKKMVLVLNRAWQAIGTKTPIETFPMLATEVATGLDIQGDESMIPVRWKDWIQLPVREGDSAIQTIRGAIRIPTVIVLANFSKVPKCRPRFSTKGIWVRDGGRCQYTGKELRPGEGNIDHVIPRAKGGKSTWTNCVLAAKEVNSKKADRLPEEVGLKLIKPPGVPREVPASAMIRNTHEISDWGRFLIG